MSFLQELNAQCIGTRSTTQLQLGSVSAATLVVQGGMVVKGPLAVGAATVSEDGGALPVTVVDPLTNTSEVKYIPLLDEPAADASALSLTFARTEHLNALTEFLAYIQSQASLGAPTKVSRLIYLFGATFAFAWMRIMKSAPASTSSNPPPPGVFPRTAVISGTHDGFDFDVRVPLADNTYAVTWFIHAIADLMPRLIPSYDASALLARERGFHNWTVTQQNAMVAAARSYGNWTSFLAAYDAWWTARSNDGWNTTGAYVATAEDVPSIATPLEVDSNADPTATTWQPLKFPDGRTQNYLGFKWDTVRTTCLTESDEAELKTYGSTFYPTPAQRAAEIADVASLSTQAQLADSLKMLAEFYAGGPGTVTPPGMFAWLFNDFARRFLPEAYASRRGEVSAQVLILLDLGVHLFEGCRITWALKAKHVQTRPITEVRHRLRGDIRTWWYGTGNASGWMPYQTANFVTPPFPDFPSGHSHFSRAFADTMTYWFGPNIDGHSLPVPRRLLSSAELSEMSPLFSNITPPSEGTLFGEFLIPAGASDIQPGSVPAAAEKLQYTNSTWAALATDAGMSRLYGGIHAISAHIASQNVADKLDLKLRVSWSIRK